MLPLSLRIDSHKGSNTEKLLQTFYRFPTAPTMQSLWNRLKR